MRKLAATLSLGLLVSAAAFTDAPAASAGNVLDNGLSLNGISMNGISMNGISMNGISMNGISANGLPSDGPAAGVAPGGLNGVAVRAVILPAVAR